MGLWSAGAALNVLQLGGQIEAGLGSLIWRAYYDILGIIGMGLLAEAVSFLCHGVLDWRIFVLGSASGTLFWAVQALAADYGTPGTQLAHHTRLDGHAAVHGRARCLPGALSGLYRQYILMMRNAY